MENIKTVLIEAIVMDNGEVLHYGKSLGFIGKKQRELLDADATKLARGGEIVIAIGKDNVA